MTNCTRHLLIAAAVTFAPSGWAAKIALAPIADAYVQNGPPASLNFANTKLLKVQTGAAAIKNFESYLKFDMAGIPAFSSARLRLYAAHSGNSGVVTMLHSVTDTTWAESTITWTNKPALGAALASRNVTSKNFEWYEFDVTTYLLRERTAGRNLVTLALHAPSASSHAVEVNSRQAIANKPRLVFTLKSTFTVSLTSPISGATYAAGASITLSAIAANADGTITKVEFFAGSTLIGTVTQSPYTLDWTSAPSGNHVLIAKATDNLGVITTSGPVQITVTARAALYFIHPDHLNTPRVITNQAQKVVWRWDNDDPFGGNMANENPSGLGHFTCNLRFPGQYFDRETNNHYNYFRDYSPEIGRYVQSDPIGLDGGLNTYAYVSSNALVRFDPLGLVAYCTFDISRGYMSCVDIDTGADLHESSGWVTGTGTCQNNPSEQCISTASTGPIPPNGYISSGVPPHRKETNTSRRSLSPMNLALSRGRTTLQTHFCTDIRTCSTGCIAHPKKDVMNAFNQMLDTNPGAVFTVIDQDF